MEQVFAQMEPWDYAFTAAFVTFIIIERLALRSWSPWAFGGVRLFRRCEEITFIKPGSAGLDVLLAQDKEIRGLGYVTKEDVSNRFLVMLPIFRKMRHPIVFFPVFVTGVLEYDPTERLLTFTIRLTWSFVALYGSGAIIFIALGIDSAEAWPFFAAIMAITVFPALIYFQGNNRWDNFLFLVITKLGSGIIE